MKRILLIVFMILVLFIAAGMAFLLNGQAAIKNMTINDVNMNLIEDGIYSGSFSGNRWSNEVEVTVKNNKIVEIRVIKDQMIKLPDVTNSIFSKIKEMQSLKVDTISEASVTTKAYLKAVENALTSR